MNLGRAEYIDGFSSPKNDRQETLLKIINSFPGIRYNDIIRLTSLKNGSLSHHLSALEKNSRIKVIRTEFSNITRYYPASTPSEETLILGYLKIKTTREIILMLDKKNHCTFNEIVSHIGKAPSTTSWNLKRLTDSHILIKDRWKKDVSEYTLKNPSLTKALVQKNNSTFLDRCVDNYSSLIEDL